MAKKLSGWHRLFIVFASVWTVVSIIGFYSLFPDKEYIEKEQLNDVAETINRAFELLNKKRDAGGTFTIKEEKAFEFLNKKKVLGLPKRDTKYKFTDLIDELHVRYILDKVALDKIGEKELIVKRKWHDLTELLISQYKEIMDFSNIEKQYKLNLRPYHKKRRNAIYLFPLYWLAPIGLVYSLGWCVGWIYRGFRKDKQ